MGIGSWLGIGKEITQPVDAIGNAFDKLFTSDEEKLKAAYVMEKMRQKPQILQIEINKIEAGHRSVFVSGWRPFIGWICGASLVWHFIGYPIATYLTAISMPELIIPQLGSADDLMTLVISLLGLGGFRTVEKLNGKAK